MATMKVLVRGPDAHREISTFLKRSVTSFRVGRVVEPFRWLEGPQIA